MTTIFLPPNLFFACLFFMTSEGRGMPFQLERNLNAVTWVSERSTSTALNFIAQLASIFHHHHRLETEIKTEMSSS